MKVTYAITPPTVEFTAQAPVADVSKTVQVFIGDQSVKFGIGNGEQRTTAKAFLSGHPVNSAPNGTPKFTATDGEQKLAAQALFAR